MPPKCNGCGKTTDVRCCEPDPPKPDTIPIPRDLAERLLIEAEKRAGEKCGTKREDINQLVAEAAQLIRGA